MRRKLYREKRLNKEKTKKKNLLKYIIKSCLIIYQLAFANWSFASMAILIHQFISFILIVIAIN